MPNAEYRPQLREAPHVNRGTEYFSSWNGELGKPRSPVLGTFTVACSAIYFTKE